MSVEPHRISRRIFGQLMTFVAVAEILNFRRAAEAVGRSQPAVTAQINQLEDYLGVKLFIRSTRQVRLTPAGLELLDRSKKLLAETSRLISDIQVQNGLAIGQVVASFSPTIAVSLIPPVLSVFEQAYPGIRVLLREDLGAEMFAAVQTGNVDFGIGPYSRVPHSLEFRPIFRQEFFLIIHRAHEIARRGHACMKDLPDLNLLSSAFGSTAREVLDQALLSEGLVVQPKYEALQYQTLFALAAAGFGATVMPKVNPDILSALSLEAVPFRDRRLERPIGIIVRRDEDLAPAAKAFIDRLMSVARDNHNIAGLTEWETK
jgi:LysR family transcriptional regulator, carnitine catabolism transcriptional activator